MPRKGAGKSPASEAPLFGERLQPLQDRLRCPECKSRENTLEAGNNRLNCSCGATFGVKNGVPDLFNAQSLQALQAELHSEVGSKMVNEYAAIGASQKGQVSWAKKAFALLKPPQVVYHPDPDMHSERAEKFFTHAGENTQVLNVGGGPIRYRNEIALNLEAFINVDILGDAHNLPFQDDSFDSVLCRSVLEHVFNPEQVVAEMIRVLKPGGYLYAEIPFLLFFHGYPNDFRRYTREGMRYLFRQLEDLQLELSGGPVSSVIQSANILLQMLVPNNIVVRKLVNGAYRSIVFPLKYLDIVLSRHPDAHLLALGFSAFGRKPQAA